MRGVMVQWAEPGRVEIDAPQPLKLTAAQASWFADLLRTASRQASDTTATAVVGSAGEAT